MTLGGATCRRCGHSGASRTNVLGEAVCERCWETQTGLAAGMLDGGGPGQAFATLGVFRWIRQALRRPPEEH